MMQMVEKASEVTEKIPPGSDCPCGRYQDERHKDGCSRGEASAPSIMSRFKMGVTFVHVSTESTDHYYFVLPELPDDAEIQAYLNDKAAESDEDPEFWYIEHVERVALT